MQSRLIYVDIGNQACLISYNNKQIAKRVARAVLHRNWAFRVAELHKKLHSSAAPSLGQTFMIITAWNNRWWELDDVFNHVWWSKYIALSLYHWIYIIKWCKFFVISMQQRIHQKFTRIFVSHFARHASLSANFDHFCLCFSRISISSFHTLREVILKNW